MSHSSDRYSYVVQRITPSTPGGFPEGINFSAFLGSLSPIPPFSASFKSSNPGFMANSINWGPSTAGPPGISLTLTNGETGDSVTASGAGWPTGANVTITQTVDEPRRWVRSGIVVFPSHWGASFSLGTGVNSPTWGYGFTSALAEGCSLDFFLTDGLISVANATSVHTPNNVTLDFQISTANATLHGWSVDVLQNGGTLKSFLPTTDTRGPGTANGTDLTNVSLTWDGLTDSNQAVTGNITWVMTANTTTFVAGGNINDGTNSAQARLADNLDSPELTVTEIKADVAEAFLDADGQPVPQPTIYYSQTPAVNHLLVLAGDPSTATGAAAVVAKAAPAAGVVKELTVVLVRNQGLTGAQSYDLRIVDPDGGNVLSDVVSLIFPAGAATVTAKMPIRLGNRVHKYPYLKVQSRVSNQSWRDTKQGTKHDPVYYTPLGGAQLPFSNDQPLGDQAIQLGWELAEGSQTAKEVRDKITGHLGAWLVAHHFVYTPGMVHHKFTGVTSTSGQSFKFKDFIRFAGDEVQQNRFFGDCHDVASTLVLCCAAVGVEQGLLPFSPGKLSNTSEAMSTNPLRVFAEATSLVSEGFEMNGTDPVKVQPWDFGQHESTVWDKTVWDGLALVQAPQTASLSPLFPLPIDDYFDRLIARVQGFDGAPNVTVVPHLWVTFGSFPSAFPDPRQTDPLRLTQIDQ